MLAATQAAVKRRLPPFGRELLALRLSGLVPAAYAVIVVLDSWKIAKLLPRIVLPNDADPAQVIFSMLAALDVAIAWTQTITPIERRDEAIREILKFSPASLRVIDMETPELGFWILSRKNGLERPEFAK